MIAGVSFRALLVASAALRVVLIVYGAYQDAHSNLKYTDVDYRVFSDATRYILHPRDGQLAAGPLAKWLGWNIGDPYSRDTYRYTPLLAVLLLPNEIIHPAFGKVLFASCDLLIGLLLYRMLRKLQPQIPKSKAALWVGAVWLLNPVVANISTRGSAEAVLGAIVVSTLALALDGRLDACAMLLGFAVHFKIYPFIYGASLLAFIDSGSKTSERKRGIMEKMWGEVTPARIRFALTSGVTFMGLNVIMYGIWGFPFLEHSYIYHLSRRDHRHNFSLYFYPIYLSYTTPSSSLLSFVPQMVLSIGFGFAFGKRDLPFAWFVQTMAFVTFNKVCTSQYFMWYIWFLPLILPRLQMSRWKGIELLAAWVGAQAFWLSLAYRLEFLGENVFFPLWCASVVFITLNSHVLVGIIKAYR
ncbi:glycosyltransferase family 50 protein [Botryobasidium botryosum FD-172 SS1]|uniref:GPI mannosyltransferase 1 n=1 Tax=Botryobasidium botryosum (strain FD-172 SS1) TaxID=930990 RepID=A0A067MT96_BOTB1|nr:glycosyltransferase family 50 protein [Botryobasidium botryosum FD-172 SS1]